MRLAWLWPRPEGAEEVPSEIASRGGERAPTITAMLVDGPLEGKSLEAEVIEGRPPKTIDVHGDSAMAFRYCLADWVQSGRSAAYTFLYQVM
jgi:hypothetical protein